VGYKIDAGEHSERASAVIWECGSGADVDRAEDRLEILQRSLVVDEVVCSARVDKYVSNGGDIGAWKR